MDLHRIGIGCVDASGNRAGCRLRFVASEQERRFATDVHAAMDRHGPFAEACRAFRHDDTAVAARRQFSGAGRGV